MRELLICLAVKYRGDYRAVRQALKNREEISLRSLPDAITIMDCDYPEELLKLRYPPYVLFYRGKRELLSKRKMAVVGSRQMSEYGCLVTKKIIEGLNPCFTTVSGMAKGVDAVVHWNSLNTIGVLGCGLNVHYPWENEQLYQMMFDSQLVISEYPDDVRPLRHHFPFRNRIIAALGEGLIVTEAAVKSGTMLTVNETLNLGKEVYVVPHRITDVTGAGCNYLIKQGANVITDWTDTKYLTKAGT